MNAAPNKRLPTMFVSHGSPTFALSPGKLGPALAQVAAQLPALRAILVISPHWITREARVSTREQQEAWHDFGGFPEVLYTLQYSAPGAPWLAERVIEILTAQGVPVLGDVKRPLDHGTWVPMLHMLPKADVPIVQLSLQAELSPQRQMAIGRALQALRDEGVLIVGSGSFTHNLRELAWGNEHAAVQAWVDEYRDWMLSRIESGAYEDLAAYRTQAPHAVRAHPTDEHLLPLYIAIGAAGEDAIAVRRLTDEVSFGNLAMDSFVFGGSSSA